ncbi:N,N-dimethylformamidase beta subunit family domain-containing protein [Dasania marina]|uniref:N,N-dimethylformamidase beta subunit family domain-containing protein n=1 Tax=Dasania marina TaxID=471499 RepID=UPI0030DB1E75|tara:strand:+ start:27279 stop:29483 length:2205 start_codon:yes stop_codon:yes gene_type:complete
MKKVIGYSDKGTVSPGENIQFMVGGYAIDNYNVQLVRVICGDDRLSGPGYEEQLIDSPINQTYKAISQKTQIGSFIKFNKKVPLNMSEGFHFQAYIKPTAIEAGEQTLVCCLDDNGDNGFSAYIDNAGMLSLSLHSGGDKFSLQGQASLINDKWYLITAGYDAVNNDMYLTHKPQVSHPGINDDLSISQAITKQVTSSSDAELVLAASPFEGGYGNCFNGKMDRPRLLSIGLQPSEWEVLLADTMAEKYLPFVLGYWDFSLAIESLTAHDISPNMLHGELINMPARGVKGHNWDGSCLNWSHCPAYYGAIHFHDDDLIDAKWQPCFSLDLPKTIKSGVYAVKLTAQDDESYITFLVRAANPGKNTKLAFLASTATYNAYINSHWALHHDLAEARRGHVLEFSKEEAFLQQAPELGLSTYDTHTDGSGVRYSSRLRPALNHGPKTRVWNLNADTHLLSWMEKNNIEYEIISDEDVHQQGVGLLQKYRCIMTGSHPEYISSDMWSAIASFQDQGGRLMYMGGNGFYWRIAFHNAIPGVIEVRRSEDGARYWAEEPGEHYLSSNGEYGGLWRRVGTPPNELVGVGTRATGFDGCSYYRQTAEAKNPRAKFIFEGVGSDELIGDFGYILGGAAGLEIDAADYKLGTPPHALVVASSEEHSPQMLLAPEETDFHHPLMSGADNPYVKADIVFYETNNGGAVFSTGSIAWCTSLQCNGSDNNVSRITKNVISRFVSEESF